MITNETEKLSTKNLTNTINNKENNTTMSIHDYENALMKYEGKKQIGISLKVIFFVGGLILLAVIFSLSNNVRNFNTIAGYITLVVLIILFIWFYVRTVISFFYANAFELNINLSNPKLTKKANEKTRKAIALRMIDLNNKIPNNGWYDNATMQRLEDAVSENNNEGIKKQLIVLMNSTVKDASDRIIVNSAVQSGIYAALSQSPALDALLVFFVNFKMIKDIIFLYGFRPTEAKLLSIVFRTIINSLAAFQLDAIDFVKIFSGKTVSKAIPFFNGATGYIVDASIQAVTNGMLTMWVGYKTINYLTEEFKLQLLFDDIDVLDDSAEFENTKRQVSEKIKEAIPKFSKNIDEAMGNSNIKNSKGNEVANKQIVLPYASWNFIGERFLDVQKKLLELGFDDCNISFSKEYKKRGLFSKDGEVTEVLINGSKDFKQGDTYDKDAKINIKFTSYC